MEVLINGSQIGVQTNLESEQYDIDNSSGQLFSVLSELYSRPVDSCIREICTNCNDAHIMSKKEEKPFIIVLPNPDKKLFNLSIRDFGPGLNEVTISKIFTYGGSSKRDDIDSTGCLGLGAKSPYAITDTFYVKSFCDGKLTHYICFKDENNRPNKSKDPVELDTLEENGLEIIIPIWDKYDYISILKRELKYFKVKPLVYIDEGNGEKSPINIDWENDIRIQFTENVYVLPEVIHSPILYFKDEINKNHLIFADDFDYVLVYSDFCFEGQAKLKNDAESLQMMFDQIPLDKIGAICCDSYGEQDTPDAFKENINTWISYPEWVKEIKEYEISKNPGGI